MGGVGGGSPPGPADAGQALDLSWILGGRACQTAGQREIKLCCVRLALFRIVLHVFELRLSNF